MNTSPLAMIRSWTQTTFNVGL